MSLSKSEVVISRLRFEHLHVTLGIGVDRPRLSWMVETTTQNWRQALGMLPKSGDLLKLMMDALAKLGEKTEMAK
jgi:alpha-L-rhamnosidase